MNHATLLRGVPPEIGTSSLLPLLEASLVVAIIKPM